MVINIQNDISRLYELGLLNEMLADKTTKQNMIWAADAYDFLGSAYGSYAQMFAELITGDGDGLLKTRAQKETEQQSVRTRHHAEVFTPLSICRKMNDYADQMRFGRGDAYGGDGKETVSQENSWKEYVDARWLEITCGEAPYLVSRYDMETGERLPIPRRTGALDRKLRVVEENVKTQEEWLKWTFRAFQAVYGYEFQGDNLLIARVNLLMTFEEYLMERWKRRPSDEEYKKAVDIIVWNIWQMDGLTGTVPFQAEGDGRTNPSASDNVGMGKRTPAACRIFDWIRGCSEEFRTLSQKGNQAIRFDFIIGNPPYQDKRLGKNKGYAPPIYHKFMESAYQLSDAVEMIHPARFLFRAGSTPKQWNTRMLEDPHLKVLYYEQDACRIFKNTEIKGGVAITYHDRNRDYGAIKVFSPYEEINTIMEKAAPQKEDESLRSIIYVQNRFDLEALYKVYPEYKKVLGSEGRDKRFRNNIFEKVALFSEQKQCADDISVLGVVKNKRQWRYFPAAFIDRNHENLYKWKVLVVRVNGVGAAGEVLSTPVLAGPMEGYTQTFIGIGAVETKEEAENILKYIKTKFARVMLGILKITQDNNRDTWKMVPLQNFTASSDIDWSRPVHEIDRQLYSKYGLDEREAAFIETHGREME